MTTSSSSSRDDSADAPASSVRAFIGGVLMGLANLVPGISGGTMILAIGLYDRFIGAIADVTRLKLRKETIVFLMALGAGLAAAVLLLSGVAVQLVSQHRWAMYALFIGMTLGGAPELFQRMKPVRVTGVIAFVIGLGVMIWFALQSGKTQLEPNIPTLLAVGGAAASSMILPGISGSYVLLILGMYDTVIGALSISEVREAPMESLMIIGPVVIGAAAGIALLSNILKAVLSRFSGPSHGALLGLLVGSVLGLYPFREAVHPELSHRPTRKAIEAVVIKDKSVSEIAAATSALSETDLEQHAQNWRGKTKGEMKSASLELRRFDPTGRHIGSALGLFVLGVFLTRLLGRKSG